VPSNLTDGAVSNVLADKRRREAVAQAQRAYHRRGSPGRRHQGHSILDPDDHTLGVPAAAGMG
jgi:hypothetical protein